MRPRCACDEQSFHSWTLAVISLRQEQDAEYVSSRLAQPPTFLFLSKRLHSIKSAQRLEARKTDTGAGAAVDTRRAEQKRIDAASPQTPA